MVVGGTKGAEKPGRRRKAFLAPVLNHIIHGTSATSLNLIKVRDRVSDGNRLFRKPGLYQTIVFKYPDFVIGRKNAKPIETGIYVPNDPDEPHRGGYGIYMKRPSHKLALKEMLGIDADTNDPDLLIDLRVLDVLDELPTLDPFLVKSRLNFHRISVSVDALSITDEEVAGVQRIVERRIGRIIHRATGQTVQVDRIQRFLASIWNPRTKESVDFFRSFGLGDEEIPAMMFALQGITYYEYISLRSLNGAATVGEWLKGHARRPEDIDLIPVHERDRLEMLRMQVVRGIADSYRYLTSVFEEYDEALRRFSRADDPVPLQKFLRQAEARFWRIGFSIAAVLNSEAVVDRVLRTPGLSGKFQTVRETLDQLRLVVDDRSATKYF